MRAGEGIVTGRQRMARCLLRNTMSFNIDLALEQTSALVLFFESWLSHYEN